LTDKKTIKKSKKILTIIVSIFITALVIFSILLGFRIFTLQNPKAQELSQLETARFNTICTTQYPRNIVNSLFWDSPTKNIDIGAESAIMINTANGDILFEKNSDELIPPASMTKLVVMYVVFQEIANGKISMDDIVPLSPQSWAQNAPPNSSLMFLEQGQTVTLRELLLGLAVCSGNDAAIAVAEYVSGSVDNFVERMNTEIAKLGLIKTHFVEPSGYDEHNVTTAREFASFARMYVTKFPEALTDFHSQISFTYPKERNLAPWHKNDNKEHGITQYNTNKALKVIDGVNGLKTGFIYESGYNISITAQRNGTQLLTVALSGKGNNSAEGNWWRIHDASTMLESAFSSIKTFLPSKFEKHTIAVAGGKKSALFYKEAWSSPLTIPYTPEDLSQQSVSRKITISKTLTAPIKTGQKIGTETYSLGNITIAKIPLVADRTILATNVFMQFIDNLAVKFIQ
jgi:D-alanyl-D-alanine carboxypeptidase (penicillin-binding protein 5/6)